MNVIVAILKLDQKHRPSSVVRTKIKLVSTVERGVSIIANIYYYSQKRATILIEYVTTLYLKHTYCSCILLKIFGFFFNPIFFL
jgi:hypothetical protein